MRFNFNETHGNADHVTLMQLFKLKEIMQNLTQRSHFHIAVIIQFFHKDLKTMFDHEMNRISKQII